MAFTRVWDLNYEGKPEDPDLANTLGLRIRDLKEDIRERGDIEHDWGSGGTGRHTFSSGDIGARDALTDVVNGMLFFRTDLHKLEIYDSGAWTTADFDWLNYEIGAAAARPTASDLPHGYLFFNTDDEVLERYDSNLPGWFPVNGKQFVTTKYATVADQAFTTPFAAITGLSQAVTIPDDGLQYELITMAVVKYEKGNGGAGGQIDIELRRDTVQVQVDTDDAAGINIRNTAVLVDHLTTAVNGQAYTMDVRAQKAGGILGQDDINPNSSFSFMVIWVKPRLP